MIHSIYKSFQIDFGDIRELSGLKTKGLHEENSWVETFSVEYSIEGVNWISVKDKNTNMNKLFVGNKDSDSLTTQYFDEIVEGRYLRITPMQWHTSIGMRLEVIGCYRPYSKTTIEPPIQSKPPNPYITEGPPPLAISKFTLLEQLIRSYCLGKNCLQDMTGTLNKNQITLTSVWKEKYDKFGKGAILLNSESGWRPENNGVHEHIKVKY